METVIAAILASFSQKMLAWVVEKIGMPILQLGIRKGMLIYDTQSGKMKYKKLEKAKEENDEQTYDDIANNC